jgi:hypothetical protein
MHVLGAMAGLSFPPGALRSARTQPANHREGRRDTSLDPATRLGAVRFTGRPVAVEGTGGRSGLFGLYVGLVLLECVLLALDLKRLV